MAGGISNTAILIKRSTNTSTPSSLKAGELAFSYASNNIFIGTSDGSGAVAIGGKSTYDAVNNATNANTVSTLVKRDANGAFSGKLLGTADKAVQLETSRDFSISGGDITATVQSFNGTNNVTLSASLDAVPGLVAGTVGSTTSVPIITYGANGRILSITSEAIATSLGISGDSGTDSIPGGETLAFTGGEGITTLVSNNEVSFDVDDTVVRSNTATSLQTIDSDLTVSGNLVVLGTQTYINTETLNVSDPMIYLAGNNTSDAVDIGFLGHYTDGSAVARHAGFIRNAGDKEFYVFDGYTPEPDANNDVHIADASFHKANVNAGYAKANVIGNTVESDGFYGRTDNQLYLYPSESYAVSGNQYIVVDPTAANHIHLRAGGTIDNSTAELFLGGENTSVQVSDAADAVYINANSKTSTFNSNGTLTVFGKVIADGLNLNNHTQAAFDKANTSVQVGTPFTQGNITIAGAGNTLVSLANNEYVPTGSVGAGKAIMSLTVDNYGRVTAATYGSITGNVSNLAVNQGGTGVTSFTAGEILLGNGTGAVQSLANSSFTETGSGATNNTLTALTVDTYGRLTAATYQAISGLTVTQGGTGFSTAANNGIVFGNGTAALGVTAVAGAADQTWSNQILTVTNAGVPVWTNTMDGGSF
jgi:hypothetical protein